MYELLRNFLMGLGSRRLKDIKGNELSLSPISPVHKTDFRFGQNGFDDGSPIVYQEKSQIRIQEY